MSSCQYRCKRAYFRETLYIRENHQMNGTEALNYALNHLCAQREILDAAIQGLRGWNTGHNSGNARSGTQQALRIAQVPWNAGTGGAAEGTGGITQVQGTRTTAQTKKAAAQKRRLASQKQRQLAATAGGQQGAAAGTGGTAAPAVTVAHKPPARARASTATAERAMTA
jgi:hypothetical protein